MLAALLAAFASLGAQAPDTTPPDTSIDKGPQGTVEDTSATFAFSADEAGTTFECSKEQRPYETCTSPRKYYGYADGEHSFAVRAIDAAGNIDPTPATRTWTVRQPASTTTTTAPATTSTTTSPPTTTAPWAGDPLPVTEPVPPMASPPVTTRKADTTKTEVRVGTSSSTSTSTTEATVVPRDLTPAIVLPPPSSPSADAEAPASGGENLAVEEARQRRRRIWPSPAMGLGLALLLAGAFGAWRMRPRYDPA
jgi:large repetitive protein